MKKIVLILLFISVNYVFSQVTLEWVKYNSGPSGSSTYNQIIKTDPAGNSYISGSYADGIQFKGFSFKYSTSGAAGTTYWTANQMLPTCFWIDNNYNTYSGGYFNQSPIRYLDVYKCSPQGFIWEVKDSLYGYGGNEALDITSDDEGNTYLLRFEGIYSIYKYSPNGTCTKHPLSGIPEAAKITVNNQNKDIFIAYYKSVFGREGHVVKYDSTFSQKWDCTFGIIGDITKLICTSSGKIFTLDDKYGITYIDSAGNKKWQSACSGSPYDMVIDYAGNIITTGYTHTEKMIFSNYTGSIIWSVPFPGKKVCVDYRNNIYIVSRFPDKLSVTKKLTETGYSKWTYNYNSLLNTGDSTCSFSLDSSLNIYACCSSYQNSTGSGIIIKLKQLLSSVSGIIRYRDNGEPVNGGTVKAYNYDRNTGTLITIDTAIINANGQYTIPNCPADSLYIIAYKKYEFIPTYRISTIDWQAANLIYPLTNLNNIDVDAERIVNVRDSFRIVGIVWGHYGQGATSLEDAFIYAKKQNVYKRFSMTTQNTFIYRIDSLQPGEYEFSAYRIGYQSQSKTVVIGDSVLKRVDFDLYLISSVSNDPLTVPKLYKLFQNYPNPFNPSTKISFDIPASSDVKITVYDFLGREIETIIQQHFSAGSYEVNWNASNYSSGVYFYKLTAGDYTESKKMILLK